MAGKITVDEEMKEFVAETLKCLERSDLKKKLKDHEAMMLITDCLVTLEEKHFTNSQGEVKPELVVKLLQNVMTATYDLRMLNATYRLVDKVGLENSNFNRTRVALSLCSLGRARLKARPSSNWCFECNE